MLDNAQNLCSAEEKSLEWDEGEKMTTTLVNEVGNQGYIK